MRTRTEAKQAKEPEDLPVAAAVRAFVEAVQRLLQVRRGGSVCLAPYLAVPCC